MSHEFLARFTGPGMNFLLACLSPVRQLLVPLLHHWGQLAGLAVWFTDFTLGRRIHHSTPMAAFVAPSDSRRASSQGGGFQLVRA